MIHEIIKRRRSTVLFSSEPVDENIIHRLFEAARWAPSSLNQQPWRFVYVLKADSGYGDILDCLSEKNREWAKNAPVLVVTIAQVIADYKDRKNMYAWHDTAMAYSNLVFQAVHEGLAVHPMGGYDRERIVRVLKLPERYEPVVVAAVGYRSESSAFAAELLTRENTDRKRKPLNEIVFRETFRGS